ncbi:MAG: serine acetyltransferase [Planctomycetes bacterium]|nr:serine acetyltransferase [Planctomycetota bacterium]
MSRKKNSATPVDLADVLERMLTGYAREPRTHRLDGTSMPSLAAIAEVQHLCFQILFPGYFGASHLTAETIGFHIGERLVALDRELSEQIFRCLCYQRGAHEEPCPRHGQDCRDEAHALARRFGAQLPQIRDLLNLDVEAAFDGDPAAKSFDEIIFCYPGFKAVMVYRLAHALHTLGVPLMPRIMAEQAHSLTGVDIHPGATIGKRFFIDHGTGVVIGETTEIGDNVKIYQGVTLGALSFPKDSRGRVIKGRKRHPTIEDDVTIYANATILGGDTVIGRGAEVGGNTFIFESVTAESMVRLKRPELHTRPKRPAEPGPARD